MCKCGDKTAGAAIAAAAAGTRGVGAARGGRTIEDLVPTRTPPQPRFHGLVVTSPCVWGPTMWKVLHTLAEFTNTPGVPPISREWRILLNSLSTCMPCPECAKHYQKWCEENPISDPISRVDIRLWLMNLHNRINVADGKGVFTEDRLSTIYGGDKYTVLTALRPLVINLRAVIGKLAVDCMVVMVQKTLSR